MVSIWLCAELARHCAVVAEHEDRGFVLCRTAWVRLHSAEYKYTRTFPYLIGLPSRSSLRDYGKGKTGPPPLKLRRDSLRSALRCERRLEPTGLPKAKSFGSSFRASLITVALRAPPVEQVSHRSGSKISLRFWSLRDSNP